MEQKVYKQSKEAISLIIPKKIERKYGIKHTHIVELDWSTIKIKGEVIKTTQLTPKLTISRK